MNGAVSEMTERAARVAEEYSGSEDRPLGSYAAFIAAYTSFMAAALGVAHRTGRTRRRLSGDEIALLVVATFQLSRLLSKDSVASPLRAPFTRYERPGSPGESQESPRGGGIRHALGELVACPFCLSQWIATIFVFGYLYAPLPTRCVATILSVRAGSDLLQFAHAAADRASQG